MTEIARPVRFDTRPGRPARAPDRAGPGPLLPGLALAGILALAAMQLGSIDWLAVHGFSALTIAIVLGIVIGNTLYPRLLASAGAGVNVSKQSLLRAGVVLYGLRLTLHDVGAVGAAGVLLHALGPAPPLSPGRLVGPR